MCWCACFPCTPPLLAGVCGVGVGVWAWVSAAPRHSPLGFWGVHVCVPAPPVPRHSWLGFAAWVCVLGLGFRLRPATPGWGVGVCVCWCARSAYTPPLLAGVCGVGVCVWARVSAAPRHSWPDCSGVRVGVRAPPVPRQCWLGRVAWVCVFGFGFWLRPTTPGLGVGVCVCWCGRSPCTPPLLAGVCGVGVVVWVRVSAAPRHSWLGYWGVCVLVWALPVYPATPGLGVRRGFVCLGSGFGRAPPLQAGVLGCACWCACSPCTPPLLAGVCGVGVCACVRVWAAPRHSPLGCWGACVLVCALRLHPPLLAGVCGVGVCVWARVSAAPRHSWLGCSGVCVLVCLFRSYPANPGWDVQPGCVCSGSGFGCAPPLLAGVLGCVCAGVGAPLVPRHSWLGCAVWVCVFGLGFWLRPATPGWGVGLCVLVCVLPLYPATLGWGVRRWCVCLGSGFGCAPPLLAGGLGCVCARVGAPLVPCHSWLGCAAWVCMFGLGFGLRPATPGWGVGVCVLMCVLPLYPPTPGWGVRHGCVCLRSGFGCAPPLLAGMLGYVCAGVRAPLAPRHSWLGCAVWVCVFGLGFWLRPANPGWGVCVCVCLCA